jgi:signal transduction histidine kinase/CheY-like chemotaxis protein
MARGFDTVRLQVVRRLTRLPKLDTTAWAVILVLGFIATALTGTLAARFPSGEPADWMATSFLIAMLAYLPGQRRWLTPAGCLTALGLLQLAARRSWPDAAAFTLLTAAEAGLGAMLLLRLSRTPRLRSLADLVKLAVLVVAPTTAASAAAYAGYVQAMGGAHAQAAGVRWLTGHATGMLVMLPLLILLRTPFKAKLSPLSRVETLVYGAGYLLVVTLPFNGLGMYLFVLVPVAVVLMAFRLGPRPTAIGVVAMNLPGELAYYLGAGGQTLPPGFNREVASFYGEAYGLALYLGGLSMALALFYHVRLKRQLEIRAEAARRARTKALLADRAKTEFLANMSHEIRTPLNGVIGVAGTLARTRLTAGQREMVGLIESSGATLERLVSGILDFSKIEAGRLEIEHGAFDLRAALDPVVELFRMQAQGKGLTLEAEYGATARGRFVGDPVRLKQVIGNLLSNAVKFTAAGEVHVRVEVRDADAAQRPCTLVLDVRDTGVGFDAAFADTLFTRFNQADASISRRFGGTGLGLSITRGLVELMGGEISAASQPGEGAHFRVRLPMPRDGALEAYDLELQAQGSDDVAADAARRPLEGLRVLLAEDHPTNQRVVQLILGPLGVELSIAENGVEAVEAFGSGIFDLVLMDMQMPLMDGREATRRIRALEAPRRRTPIIAMTANAQKEDRAACLEAGMDDFISKPVDPRRFLAVVEQWLDPEAPPAPAHGDARQA